MTQMLCSHWVQICLCTRICQISIFHFFMNIDFLSLNEIKVPAEKKKKKEIQIADSICLLFSMHTFLSYLLELHHEISNFDIMVHGNWALLAVSLSLYCAVELEVSWMIFLDLTVQREEHIIKRHFYIALNVGLDTCHHLYLC